MIEGLDGSWVSTGLMGCQKNGRLVIFGANEEAVSVAPLDLDQSSKDNSLNALAWDLLATILTDDRSGMIFRQVSHNF